MRAACISSGAAARGEFFTSHQVASASGATSIQFKKASLKLEVTPQITPEGNIILDLDVNKDTVGQSTAAGFAINTKHIKTQVLDLKVRTTAVSAVIAPSVGRSQKSI